MATAAMVPLEEYLQTSYEPDREWVDGQVRERSMPDGYHGFFQGLFVMFFERRRSEFGLRALSEVRIRVSAGSYRIPDVLVIPDDAAFLPTPTVAPLICVEILSPDDRAGELQEKIEEYAAMGVEAIWVVDPRRRTMSIADGETTRKVQEFSIPGTNGRISADDLFGELDELERRRV